MERKNPVTEDQINQGLIAKGNQGKFEIAFQQIQEEVSDKVINDLISAIAREQSTIAGNAKAHKDEFKQASEQISRGICEQIGHTLIESIAQEQINKAMSAHQSAKSFSEGAK